MRLTILGSGNAAGMPVYGCNCVRCNTVSNDSKLQRGPACALLEVDNKQYLIDAGLTGIRQRYPAGNLNGIFVTHFHADHVQGLFDLRWGKNLTIPVYCPPDSNGCDDLYKHPGILEFNQLKKFNSFNLESLQVTPLPLIHSKVTFGYVFECNNKRIAYLTDTKGLPPKTIDYFERNPLELLVIDTSYPPGIENSGHNNLDETLLIQQQVKSKRTVLTHISHGFDIWLSENTNSLPDSVIAGYDGLTAYPY